MKNYNNHNKSRFLPKKKIKNHKMKINLDNISRNPYNHLSMQNLKEVKRRAEEQIRGFQQELEIINRAIEITKKYGANGIKDDVADLRKMADSKSFLEPEEIEMAILAIKGDFKAEDVISEVKKRFAERPNCSTNAIATALHRLIKAGKLRYVRERAGRRPAIYKGAL